MEWSDVLGDQKVAEAISWVFEINTAIAELPCAAVGWRAGSSSKERQVQVEWW